MKEAAVLKDPSQELILEGLRVSLAQYFRIGLFDEVGQVNTRGAYRLAGLATEAVLHDGLGVFPAVIKIGEDQTDR